MNPTDPRVIGTVRELQAWSDAARAAGRRIGLVPPMGALHPGHCSLVRLARQHADRVVVSIFVNPTQFGPGEDLERYPRDFEADRAKIRAEGTDVIFAPSVDEMYPRGDATSVEVERLTEGMCGRGRPGHFKGVPTVVARLLHAAKPHLAIFGEKDYQQLVTVRRMVRDLCMDVKIIGGPTVREPDGVAMSSRNAYLSPAARQQARCLNAALTEVRELHSAGEGDAQVLIDAARRRIEKEPLAEIDYIEDRDAEDLATLSRLDRRAVMGLAVRFEGARLIDNAVLEVQ